MNKSVIGLEEIKIQMNAKEVEYISFDIFDTLIVRHLLEPTDLFFFLGIEANKVGVKMAPNDFMFCRSKAEQLARNTMGKHRQDITLDDIYTCLQHQLSLTEEIAIKIKQKEIALELKVCMARKSGMELYEYAYSIGKKVICISDMYLPHEIIHNILDKNCYNHPERIFVSSEIGLGKYSGDLYCYVLSELGIKPIQVLHIGDNMRADVEMAQTNGISAFLLPKTKDLYSLSLKMASKSRGLMRARLQFAISANFEKLSSDIDYKQVDIIYQSVFKDYLSVLSDDNFLFKELKKDMPPKRIFYYICGLYKKFFHNRNRQELI